MAEEEKNTPENKPRESKGASSIDENKLFGILSYISFLCLIPLFVKKDNEFVYFHAKQGLVLFILEIAVYILNRIVSGFLFISIFTLGILQVWGLIMTLVNLGLFVLAILGIVNVIQNQKKELPLIGKYAEKIKI